MLFSLVSSLLVASTVLAPSLLVASTVLAPSLLVASSVLAPSLLVASSVMVSSLLVASTVLAPSLLVASTVLAPSLLVDSTVLAAPKNDNAKLNLDIYYESLCPDSIRFIVNQVTDTWAELGGEDVGFRFIPYGFAETTQTEDGYSFQCQHGPRECHGNLVQACTVAHISSMSARVGLISCMEGAPAPDTAGPDCFQQYNLDFAPIQACVDGSEGGSLVAANGVEQNGLNPRPNNMPWLNFNGEHMAEYWDIEQMGLTNYICNTFGLKGCKKHQFL